MTGDLVNTISSVAEFVRASKSDNTRRAYGHDWADFERWCASYSLSPLPAEPETVARYLASLAGHRKLATIRRRAAAITSAHQLSGCANPAAHAGVKATLQGIARTLGQAQTKKAAITADLMARMVRKLPTDVLGLRDRALLLLGFAAALRRSELVALDVLDLERHPKGLIIRLRRSKTDQAGAGIIKAIPHGRRLHVMEAIDAWLVQARIVDGAVFRQVRGNRATSERLTAGQVARIVKKRAASIGLDPSSVAGHSLRSGFITSAAEAGASLNKIADQAGHTKLDTTRGYIQVSDAFHSHAGAKFL